MNVSQTANSRCGNIARMVTTAINDSAFFMTPPGKMNMSKLGVGL